MTLEAATTQELFDAARQRGLFLMEAMWMATNPVVRTVLRLLGTGEHGRPLQVHADLGFPVRTDPTDRLLDPALGGGALLDMGVYPVTFAFAAFIFLLCVVIGIVRHGLHFFTLFVPPQTPIYLLPLILPIELISFLSRPLTLSVRLFANMTAGHILLQVFAGFIVSLGLAGGALAVLGILPLAMNVALYALELLVAVVQAYVFALLTCVYLNDSINLSH